MTSDIFTDFKLIRTWDQNTKLKKDLIMMNPRDGDIPKTLNTDRGPREQNIF